MRYIINVLDDIPNPMWYVNDVMSDTDNPYCAATRYTSSGVVVVCDKTKTGYKFTVYREKK